MKSLLSFIFLLSLAFTSGLHSRDVETLEIFEKGMNEFFETDIPTENFKEAARRLPMPGLMRHHEVPKLEAWGLCTACSVFTNLVVKYRKHGATRESLLSKLTTVCSWFGIETKRVCKGFINLNMDIFLYIVDNGDNVGDRFCALALQNRGCTYENAVFDWQITIPPGRSIATEQETKGNKFNILHLSDYHYDPMYTPGVTFECGEPMCCQSDQQVAKSDAQACGYWGAYKDADAPWHLIEEVLKQTNSHEFDYVYFTGDIIAHRVWETSVEKNSRDIRKIYQQMKESYKVPVYPVLGNHESTPMNQWSYQIKQANVTQNWLFELIADEWSQWMGEKEAEQATQTIKKGGYYTVSPRSGFRIVALNSNVCYCYNWWLIYSDIDPYGQLQWLADILYEAEKNGESVHIISHVPTGDEACLKTWSREYNRIIERFANTITGQFTGHTHYDEFNVYYNKSNLPQPIGVTFNGASVTTYINNNPSYKVFQVDADTYKLLDYEEWTFNLTHANLHPDKPVEWFKLYSFTEAYGVENLEPQQVASVVEKMTQYHVFIQTYYGFKYRWADPSLAVDCDKKCQKELLCSMVTTEYGEDEMCERVKKSYG